MGEAALKTESNSQYRGLVPFKPGQSGNPGGRPKGIAAYIREQTMDGRELADFLLEVMRTGGRFSKMSDRIYACELLMDRSLGKIPQVAEGDKTLRPVLNLDLCNEQELEFLKNVRLGLLAIRERIGGSASQEEAK